MGNQIISRGRCLVFINRKNLRHFKLEIALVNPASNDEK